MKRLIFYITLIIVTLHSFGQVKSALALLKGDRQVADQFYDNLDFRSALHFYEKALEKNPKDSRTKEKVARCHINLDDPQSAMPLLADLTGEPSATTDIQMLYAETLRRNGEVGGAMDMYRKILKKKEDNKEIASKLEFLENLDYYTRDNTYTVNNLDLNSEQSDFSYQPFKNGYLFLSSRQTERFIQHLPATATNEDEGMIRYFIEDGSVNEPVQLEYGEKFKPYYHDGPLSFYQDFNRVAFTRNNLRDATRSKGSTNVNLKIFLADCRNEGYWQDISPFEYNSDDYSVGHPTLSSDGKIMYFSSDMPGGFGGPDIYVTRNDSGRWTRPLNLGPEVNTSGDELFPSLANDSTLYFSSTGLGGFGGLDLFISKLDNWLPIHAKNMGTPLNSEADDFAILVDSTGRNGYFSSNRTGGKGHDDIYGFETILFAGAAKVITRQDSIGIPNADVTITTSSGLHFIILKSDDVGIIKMELPYDDDYLVTANKEGYSHLFKAPYSTVDNKISYDTLLLPMWRDELFAEGRIFSNETQGLISDATIVLTDLVTGLKDSVITGDDGTYHFPLTPDSRYHVQAKHDGFLEDGFDINTANLYRGNLLNDVVLEEVFVERVDVYFEFDQSNLDRNYNKDLKTLMRTLKRFPESIINVAAHADSRGEEAYNKRLSNDRLSAVTQWFRRNGINNDRIHGTAFGEELLLNQCSDGVVCEEEDHSKNRRAEIKVQLSAIH